MKAEGGYLREEQLGGQNEGLTASLRLGFGDLLTEDVVAAAVGCKGALWVTQARKSPKSITTQRLPSGVQADQGPQVCTQQDSGLWKSAHQWDVARAGVQLSREDRREGS